MMKKSLFVASALLIALAGCQDDTLKDGTGYPATVGDEIQFSANHAQFEFNENSTRTIYGDRDGDSYPIYWENGDQIGIFCPQASYPDVKEFYYQVLVDDETSSVGTLAKVNPGENGLQWGDGDEHDFYAIYPATASTGGTSATTVSMSIPIRQDPIRITKEGDTWTAYPNMDYAYMYAHTQVSRETQGDQPISLNFKPIVTTLEITVNGPVSGSFQVSQVMVRSSHPLTGDFQLTVAGDPNDVNDGSCTPVSNGTVNTEVTIPTYYEDEAGRNVPVTLAAGEKLVVKAFMLPYADPEASQTAVTINMVGQGSNTKVLSTADIQPRKINITSLPALEGTDFYYWMSALDENIYYSQLSIPGTHNSYSIDPNVRETNTVMGAYQKRTIEEQFQAGARAFSFMVGFSNDDFSQAVDFGTTWGGECYTYWNDDYPLYVYDANTQGDDLSNVLTSYATMLSNAIADYNAPAGRTCQEFIVLNLNYKQMASNGDNYADKFTEVKRWIREVDRILDEYQPVSGVELVTNITPETTISDLKGKILVFVNYQAPELPNAEGAISPEWYQRGEDYSGYTFTPGTDVHNYVFLRNAYNETRDAISQTLYTSNDRDITYPYYMIPEGPGSSVYVWKQHLERLENPELSVSVNYSGRINTKINMIEDFFQQAIDNNNQAGTAGLNNWYINDMGGFCVVNDNQSYNPELGQSGNTVLAANQINGPIYTYMSDRDNNSGPVGVVLMNFFGESFVDSDVATGGQRDVYGQWLPQIVIENNFRFALKIKDGSAASQTGADASYASGGQIIR